MNAPFFVSQLFAQNSTLSVPGNQTVVRLERPAGGAAVVVQLEPGSRIDFQRIANEQIILVRTGDRLVILFQDQSSIVLQGFFDGLGRPLDNLSMEVAGGQIVSGQQFAGLFPISTDQSILPAAGPASASGANGSSKNTIDPTFEDPSPRTPLDLLGNEEFGQGPTILPLSEGSGPAIAASQTGILADEDGFPGGNIGGIGDVAGEATVVFGDLDYTFGVNGASAATPITFDVAGLPALTSRGLPISYSWTQSTLTLTATTSAGTVFTLVITDVQTGAYTFTLSRSIDHPITGTEDTIALLLPFVITDGIGAQATGSLSVQINDDTAVITAPVATAVDEEGLLGPGDSEEIEGEGSGSGGNPGEPNGASYAGSDLPGTATTSSGSLGISWGADDANPTTGNAYVLGDRAVVFAPGITAPVGLTSNGIQLVYTLSANGTVLTATAGPGGPTVFTVTLNETTGTYSFTLLDNLDHPAANTEDDQVLTFAFVATDSDGDTATSSFQVTVDDDAPVITAPTASAVDEEGLRFSSGSEGGGFASGGNPGEPSGASYAGSDLPGTATTSFGLLRISWGADDANPTTGNAYVLGDRAVAFAPGIAAPVGLTSNGTQLVYTLSANGTVLTATAGSGGPTVFTVTLNETTGTYSFTLLDNLDHPTANTEDDQVLTFAFVATDSDGDTATSSFQVTVDDDAPVITAPAASSVDEEGLATAATQDDGYTGDLAGTATTSSGSLGIAWGADDANPTTGNAYVLGDRAVAFASGIAAPVGLTSNGTQLVYTLSANGTVLTATAGAGGPTVFTVTLNETTGTYSFTLLDNLDHPTANTEDDQVLTFAFVATDSDGDTATSSFQVTIDDDAPVITAPAASSVDEEGLATAATQDDGYTGDLAGTATTNSGSLGITWGADDANPTTGNAYVLGDRAVAFASGIAAPVGLTSNGTQLVYTLSANGTVLTATAGSGGPTVFTVTLNETTGTYSFTLLDNLDHPTADTEDDQVLTFAFVATDSDGDTATSSFQVSVDDDAPRYTDTITTGTVDEEWPFGNLFEEAAVAGDAEGTPSFTENSLNIAWGADDQDSGSDSLTLTGRRQDNVVGSEQAPNAAMGRAVYFTNATVAVADEAGNPVTLTSRGYAVTFSLSDSGTLLTGTSSDGRVIFTVRLSDDGSGRYTYVQQDELDHPYRSDPAGVSPQGPSAYEDDLSLLFNVTARDFDGDTASSQFTVTVDDDTPIIDRPDDETVDEDGRFPSLVSGEGNPSGNGDAFLAGTVESGDLDISWGADNGNSAVNGGIAGSPVVGDRSVIFAVGTIPALQAMALTSNGASLVYALSNNDTVLTARAGDGGPEVFRVTLTDTGDGGYTFQLFRNLDHPPGNNENNIDLTFGFVATDADGDAVVDSFEVSVDDDTLVQGGIGNRAVDEEGLAGGNDGLPPSGQQPPGNIYSGSDLAGTATTTLSTSLGIAWGADRDLKNEALEGGAIGAVDDPIGRTVSFATASGTVLTTGLVSASDLGLSLTSDGVALQYRIDYLLNVGGNWNGGYVLTGYLAGTDPTVAANQVFRLTIDPTTTNGSYVFQLLGNLDHPPTPTNSENDLRLDFRIRAMDSDGDLGPTERFSITVDDDAPQISGTIAATTVDEDGGLPGGNPGGPDDSTADSSALGTLNISWGADSGDGGTDAADSNGTFTQDGVGPGGNGTSSDLTGRALFFTSASVTASTTLRSDGAPVLTRLAADGTRLEGYVAATQTSPERLVFEVSLSDDGGGAYRFRLLDNLDHPTPGTEDQIALTFGFTARDSDGDNVIGTFTVNVDDDTPVITAPAASSVDEEGLATAATQDDGYTGDLAGTATTNSGSLGITWGADDANPTTGNAYVLGDRAVAFASGIAAPVGLTSNGTQLVYTLSANGTVLTATAGAGGPTVFTVTLNETTGTYSFTLLDNLDHPTANTEDDQVLTFAFVATDSDGDTATSSFQVTVDDDAPVITAPVAASWFDQTFDTATNAATSGFVDGTNGWFGNVAVLASGTNGIVTASGSGSYALLTQGGTPGSETGPFTRFDDYKSSFLGGFTASVDIYLDPAALGAGQGFDYSVAANRQDGTHLRDFIFHVTKDTSTGQLLVGASNNTGFAPREDLETLANHEVIGTPGWYTFQHVFYARPDGTLAVDLVLRNAAGVELFRETRSDPSDVIATIVGGNRYGWFTNIDVPGGIAVDNVQLTSAQSTSVVNEDDLTAGTDTSKEATSLTGTLGVAWGADDANPTAGGGLGDRSLAFSGPAPTGLTSGGVALEYVYAAGNATLTAYRGAGRTAADRVFEVTLNDAASGSYTFTLLGALDHAPGSGQNLQSIVFGYTATDSDGDVASSSFTVAVQDDTPIAVNDSGSGAEDSGTIVVNLLTNDVPGADGIGSVSLVGSPVFTPGPTSPTGSAGTFTLVNGVLSFTPAANWNGTAVFTYRLTDGDGDAVERTATITVSAENDAPVIGSASVRTGVVLETGDLAGIDEAGLGGGLEPLGTLNATITGALATLPGAPAGLLSVLSTVQGALGGDLARAIAVVWDYLDDAYVGAGPNQPNINEAFVRLGVAYVEHLKAGGSPLVDVTAKFTADGPDAGTNPDREQSLHDNLLGNLSTVSLTDRFSGPLLTQLTALVSGSDPDLLTRPYYSGNEGTSDAAARAWDLANGYVVRATGTLVASDADADAVLTWSVNTTAGVYGTFALDATSGVWTYTLDNARAATQGLSQGQSVTETFVATVTDQHGANDSVNVVVTVQGTNDAPVIAGLANASVAENVGGALIDGFTVTDVDTANGLTFRVLRGGVVDTRFEVVAASGTTPGQPGSYELRLRPGQSLDFEAENADGNPTIGLTVEVNDGVGANGIDTVPITVTVTNLNESPVILSGPAMTTVIEDASFTTAPELVVNGGFETFVNLGPQPDAFGGNRDKYSFPGWMTTGDSRISVGVTSTEHSGANAAVVGINNALPDLVFSQVLSTDLYKSYQLRFALFNPFFVQNDFTASWNGLALVSLANVPGVGTNAPTPGQYTVFERTVQGVGGTAPLTFAFDNDSAYWYFDSVSLREILIPGQQSRSGAIAFTDPDATGLYSVTVLEGAAGYLGSFSTTLTDPSGGSPGQVNWAYAVNEASLQFLAEGISVVQTYTVQIHDGPFTVTQTVTVALQGVNDAPTDISLTSTSIAENNAVNAVVGTLSSVDPDSSTFSYAITGGTGAGLFNILGNQLRATGPLDFESAPSLGGGLRGWTLNIRTTDDFGATYTETVTINVTDVLENNAPITQAYTFGIGRGYAIAGANSPHASQSIDLAALGVITDPENQPMTWSSSNLPSIFWGLTSNGQLTFDSNVATGVYQMTVTASDGVNSASRAIEIWVAGSLTTVVLSGTSNSDTIIGSSSGNNINAGNGNDFVDARGGSDTVNGQSGTDVIYGGTDLEPDRKRS